MTWRPALAAGSGTTTPAVNRSLPTLRAKNSRSALAGGTKALTK
jgi:hypothetical protein